MNDIRRLIAIFFALLVFILPTSMLIAGDGYSIVFVHIGDVVPEYAETAMKQARLFNKTCPIILVANQAAIDKKNLQENLEKTDITYIACESLKKSSDHRKFCKLSKHNTEFRNGFWKYTSERFLYLDDLMSQYNMENIFHLEYDNMLYADLSELLPIFTEHYKGIAATFDNENRCIPGFLFIRTQKVMRLLAHCFAREAASQKNDMELIGLFKKMSGSGVIDYLPIIHEKYLSKYTIFGQKRFRLKRKYDFCKNIEHFHAIFDAAAMGQYLGGIDPRNGESKPGFVNESCIFDSSKLKFGWECDNDGRWVPFATYANEKRKIINLHVHSKKLADFSSLKPQKPYVMIKGSN